MLAPFSQSLLRLVFLCRLILEAKQGGIIMVGNSAFFSRFLVIKFQVCLTYLDYKNVDEEEKREKKIRLII